MDILKQLHWRYATKQFNPNKKLNSEQLNTLLEAINLTPTSFGLQHFKVIVIENKEIREKLKAAAFDQPQISDASHLIIFVAKNNISNTHIDEFIKRIATKRGLKFEDLEEYEAMMKGKINRTPAEKLFIWASKQCYIGLGFLLSTAAQLGIDTCPMEGFDPEKVDEILGLKEKNLNSIVMASVGFRSENDKYQYAPKVRVSIDELVIRQ
jgi:nitroreductase